MTMVATQPTTQPPDFDQRDLSGSVRHIRPLDGFAILSLADGRQVLGDWSADDPDFPALGCTYRFWGVWTSHAQWGMQFRATSHVLLSIDGQAGIIAFLSRGGLGISASQAGRLWRAYGPEAVNTLRTTPLAVVRDGILSELVARAAADRLADDLTNEPVKIELFELFAGFGIPKGAVKACIRTWGKNSPAVIRRDPLQLLVRDIPGIGFKRADALYMELGLNPHRLKRQMLAGWHGLHVSSSGNTWEGMGTFYQAVLRAVGAVGAGRFEEAVRLGVRARWLRIRNGAPMLAGSPEPTQWIAEAAAAAAEERLARHVERIRKHQALWPALGTDDPVSDHQREKLQAVAGSALAILAGTPGTGKTHSAAALLRKLVKQLGEHLIKVCAPTGKAAVRITEALGKHGVPLKATTIHSLLEISGRDNAGEYVFAHNETNPLEAMIVAMDEGSMADCPLAAALLAAVPRGGNVLIIGDPFQLPPVGHGAPLRDMIAAGVPCALLTEVRRNAGTIVHACRAIKDGHLYTPVAKIDVEAGENLAHAHAEGDAAQLDMVIALLGSLASQGYNPVWDVQVVVPRNEGSMVGRKHLNDKLQGILNPLRDGQAPPLNPTFRVGDKVICLKNSEAKTVEAESPHRPTGGATYLANGDMGQVLAATKGTVIVRFLAPDRWVSLVTEKRKKKDDGTEGNTAGDLDLAYAITVHKSQGSEWPVVLVVLDDNAGPVACREWIYTAISRAARLCITVGQLRSAGKMIGRVGLQKRKTFLRELIMGEGEGDRIGAAALTAKRPG